MGRQLLSRDPCARVLLCCASNCCMRVLLLHRPSFPNRFMCLVCGCCAASCNSMWARFVHRLGCAASKHKVASNWMMERHPLAKDRQQEAHCTVTAAASTVLIICQQNSRAHSIPILPRSHPQNLARCIIPCQQPPSARSSCSSSCVVPGQPRLLGVVSYK